MLTANLHSARYSIKIRNRSFGDSFPFIPAAPSLSLTLSPPSLPPPLSLSRYSLFTFFNHLLILSERSNSIKVSSPARISNDRLQMFLSASFKRQWFASIWGHTFLVVTHEWRLSRCWLSKFKSPSFAILYCCFPSLYLSLFLSFFLSFFLSLVDCLNMVDLVPGHSRTGVSYSSSPYKPLQNRANPDTVRYWIPSPLKLIFGHFHPDPLSLPNPLPQTTNIVPFQLIWYHS